MRDSTRCTNKRGATGTSPRVRRLSIRYVNKVDVNLGSHDKRSANLGAPRHDAYLGSAVSVQLLRRARNMHAAYLTGVQPLCRLPGIRNQRDASSRDPQHACRLPGVCNHRAGSSRALQPACRLPDGRTTGVTSTREIHNERSFNMEGPQRVAHQPEGGPQRAAHQPGGPTTSCPPTWGSTTSWPSI
ncbi:uncharacterized protein LOC143205645 isoform X2 [Rhynchophorus ferrugineus]|uniref:uncharacterized protein LOC143205645 isoform X2 n=1 Tax=Rhynchophorus ferrugineus TaxID=354439 RepID=UPI003FCCE5E5